MFIPTVITGPARWSRDLGKFSKPTTQLKLYAYAEDTIHSVSAQYNLPDELKLGEAIPIVFAIEGDYPGSATAYVKRFEGQTVNTDVRITSQTSVTLTPSPNVTVKAVTAEKQLVSPMSFTTWQWDVTANDPDKALLTLKVFAWIKASGQKLQTPILTKLIEIPIKVTAWDQVRLVAEKIEPVWKSVAVVVTGVGAFLAWFGLKPTKGKSTDAPGGETAGRRQEDES